MADNKYVKEDKHEVEVEEKVIVRETKPKLIGKIVNMTPSGFTVEYIIKGVSYGARVQFDARLHSKLGVGDDIQIPQ